MLTICSCARRCEGQNVPPSSQWAAVQAPPATSCWTRQRHTSALVEHPHAVPHHLAEGQARTTIRSGWTCSQTACSSVKSFNSSGIGALGAVWQRSHPLESLSCQSERRFSSTGSSSSSSADHQQQATASAAAGHEHGAEEDEDVHHVRVDDDGTSKFVLPWTLCCRQCSGCLCGMFQHVDM